MDRMVIGCKVGEGVRVGVAVKVCVGLGVMVAVNVKEGVEIGCGVSVPSTSKTGSRFCINPQDDNKMSVMVEMII